MNIKEYKNVLIDYANSEEHAQKINNALSIIEAAKKLYPYVAYSGGKDSTVMLHLALRIIPNIMVLHWDYGKYYIPNDIREEIINNAKLIGANNIRIETSKEYDIMKREAINVLGREYIQGVIPKLHKEGYFSSFVGLSSEESVKRKTRIKANRSITNCREFYPVNDWTWRDIWAYIFSHNLPYCSYYDKYSSLIPITDLRMVTFFDPEFNKFGNSNIDSILMPEFRNI
jgi:3'-phosphoadenosine 5'-phosphosulfate sulfotransferase (PAPS reductase)/FAD synthetase